MTSERASQNSGRQSQPRRSRHRRLPCPLKFPLRHPPEEQRPSRLWAQRCLTPMRVQQGTCRRRRHPQHRRLPRYRRALPQPLRPGLVLSAEQELGITAGLQDRVIQEYEGVVFMGL